MGDLNGNGFPDRYFTSNLEDSRLYLNHGDGPFEPQELPRVAQLAPVGGIAAADFTGDDRLDLVIAGSLHELDAYTPS